MWGATAGALLEARRRVRVDDATAARELHVRLPRDRSACAGGAPHCSHRHEYAACARSSPQYRDCVSTWTSAGPWPAPTPIYLYCVSWGFASASHRLRPRYVFEAASRGSRLDLLRGELHASTQGPKKSPRVGGRQHRRRRVGLRSNRR
jgi:hypothetical protein